MLVKKIKTTFWDKNGKYDLQLGRTYQLKFDGIYWCYFFGEGEHLASIQLFTKNGEPSLNTNEEFIEQFEIVRQGVLNLPDWW